MNPGLLDRQVTLRARSVSNGVSGQPTESWSNLATVWARKLDISGSERNDQGQEVAKGHTLFIIRYRSDVNTTNRVSYGGVEYDITFIKEMGRQVLLELTTEVRTDG